MPVGEISVLVLLLLATGLLLGLWLFVKDDEPYYISPPPTFPAIDELYKEQRINAEQSRRFYEHYKQEIARQQTDMASKGLETNWSSVLHHKRNKPPFDFDKFMHEGAKKEKYFDDVEYLERCYEKEYKDD